MKTFNKSKAVGSFFITILMSLVWTIANAQTDQSETIKKMIAPQLGKGVKVDAVTKTPYSGLYEVRIGGDIVYTDDKMNYLFVGKIVDLKNQKDLTQAKLDQINNMKISDMPLDLAIKQVKGNGKRIIAIFEDPNCGYCKRFDKELEKVNNITIYTFMYNILSEASAIKSKNVWCSGDPVKVWNDMMVSGKEPPAAPATCMTNPNQQVLELGTKLNIKGTPTIFFKDGTRVPGYIDAAALEEKLANIK